MGCRTLTSHLKSKTHVSRALKKNKDSQGVSLKTWIQSSSKYTCFSDNTLLLLKHRRKQEFVWNIAFLKVREFAHVCSGKVREFNLQISACRIYCCRYRHEIILNNDAILVIGGGQKEITVPNENISSFSLKTNQWTEIATKPDPVAGFPRARKCHITVRHDDCKFVHIY